MMYPTPMGKVAYKEAQSSDLPFIMQIYRLNFSAIVDEARGWDESIESAYMAREMSQAPFLIVTYGGAEAGFLSYEIFDALYIRHIEVHPDFGGLGIGTLVIKALLKEKGEKPMRVSVTDKNFRGMDFYTNLGFRQVGEIFVNMAGSRGPQMLRKSIMQLD